MKKTRDYQDVAAQIRSLCRRNRIFTLHESGRIGMLPFYVLTAGNPTATRGLRLCISAGVHGNEPAGVWAALQILGQEDPWRWLARRAEIILFPCANPSGYERGTRENAAGIDLNRSYRARRPPEEVRIMRSLLDGMRHDLSIEFHEDIDTVGFYLYELVHGRDPRWGPRIIREIGRRYPINRDKEIDGLPARGGIVAPQTFRKPFHVWVEKRRNWPQAIYQFAKGTRRCITFETPPGRPRGERVAMHVLALNAALRRQFPRFPGFQAGAGAARSRR